MDLPRAACAVVFDFYAAVGASGGSGDLSYITLNIWNNFLLDFSIIDQKSQFLKQSDLDTLFISIDSHAARVQAEHKKEEEEAFKNKALEKKPPPGMRPACSSASRRARSTRVPGCRW